MTDPRLDSRTVDWWAVHTYAAPILAEVGSWPMVGTLTWQRLADDDPAKLAAILDAAQHHALRVEMAQDAHAEASRAVATATDWTAAAAVRAGRGHAYIPRRKAG